MISLPRLIGKIENSRWRYGLVFFAFFAIFLLFHSAITGFSSSDDPYYHAKHADLMARSGNLTLLAPWLEFHFLQYAPTDPWWGYHLLLAVPIYFFGPIWGSKILSALLAALAIAVFYGLLNNLRARRPLVFTFLFFSSSLIFLQRLVLQRPHLLALSLAPLAWILAARRRYCWLFIVAVIFTLFYQLAPVLALIVAAHTIADWRQERELNLKPLLAALAGILIGIILHPESLNYVYVMFLTFWRIPYLKLAGASLDIGGELRAAAFLEFARSNLAVLGFYVFALAASIAFWPALKKQKPFGWFILGVQSLVWFGAPLFMLRGVEYFQSFAWLFIASVLSAVPGLAEWSRLKERLVRLRGRITAAFAEAALITILLGNVFFVFSGFIYNQESGERDFDFQEAGRWLKANTKPGEIIFYPDWGWWPIMFYYNDYNHYITGMDPTFFYEYDPKLFWIWRNLGLYGVYCDQAGPCLQLPPRPGLELAAPAIRNRFGARYILLPNEPDLPLWRTLKTIRRDFAPVWQNKRLIIFKIIE